MASACRAYDGGVADSVIVVPGERQLMGEGWSLRAERVEMLTGNDWRALIGIRRGLKLLVSPGDQAGELDVERGPVSPRRPMAWLSSTPVTAASGWPGFRCAHAERATAATPGSSSPSGCRVTSCPRWSSCSERFPGPTRPQPLQMFSKVMAWPR
jgi:hypothetical protein